jgi:hypothetical protein
MNRWGSYLKKYNWKYDISLPSLTIVGLIALHILHWGGITALSTIHLNHNHIHHHTNSLTWWNIIIIFLNIVGIVYAIYLTWRILKHKFFNTHTIICFVLSVIAMCIGFYSLFMI